MVEDYNKEDEQKNKEKVLDEILENFPSNPDIYRWINAQKFQKEHGPQEYMMLFEIDMPKILKKFIEYLKTNKNA